MESTASHSSLDKSDPALAAKESGHDAPKKNLVRTAYAALSQRISLEEQGIAPLSLDQRSDPNFLSSFSLWWSMNGTIVAFSTGTLGPLIYGLSLRDSALIIVFFNLFSCFVPSYIATFGPKLGMRTLGVARYSYGYWPVVLPALLNLLNFIGFLVLDAILGSQTLVAISPGSIGTTVGIVIIALVSLAVSVAGYRVMHVFERFAWFPVLLAFIILLGVSGTKLKSAMAFVNTPATAGTILSFAALIVGFSLSWSACSADFNTYLRADISSVKVGAWTFAGLYLSSAGIQIVGAAFACAALSGEIPSWTDAFANNSTGGLIGVALIEPLGNFGKFLLVVLALGIITNCAPTVYAFSISTQILIPRLAKLPRTIFPIVATAIYLPVAIVGAQNFSAAIANVLGLVGYWVAIFVSVFLVEHFLFRRGSFASYDVTAWDTRLLLPPGYAALFSSAVGAGMVALSMDQVSYRGPIAIAIAGPDATYGGDLAFELAIAVVVPVYAATRYLEKRIYKR